MNSISWQDQVRISERNYGICSTGHVIPKEGIYFILVGLFGQMIISCDRSVLLIFNMHCFYSQYQNLDAQKCRMPKISSSPSWTLATTMALHVSSCGKIKENKRRKSGASFASIYVQKKLFWYYHGA